MINVLFIHQAAELYGSDKVLLYLTSGLRQRGVYRPIVVLPEAGPLFHALESAGVEVHVGQIAKIQRSAFSPAGVLLLLEQIRSGTRRLDAIVGDRDIALVHSNTLAVLAGAAWSWRRKRPHLWHVHEIVMSPRWVSRLFPLMLRLAADRVMSNSTLTERWLLDHQPALAARSIVVFNGLPRQAAAASVAAASFRAKTGAAPGDVLVVLAGRINHWKGQGLLIDAAALLRERGQLRALHFAVVGDTTPEQAALRTGLLQKISEMGLQQVFSLLPFETDVRAVWQSADIAVVPSLEPEPFGMVAIEAMAAERPVVAAAHGGLLDIVDHDVTGLLFEPRNCEALADALHRLVVDAVLRRRLGAAGLSKQREVFSADNQVRETELVYAGMRQG